MRFIKTSVAVTPNHLLLTQSTVTRAGTAPFLVDHLMGSESHGFCISESSTPPFTKAELCAWMYCLCFSSMRWWGLGLVQQPFPKSHKDCWEIAVSLFQSHCLTLSPQEWPRVSEPGSTRCTGVCARHTSGWCYSTWPIFHLGGLAEDTKTDVGRLFTPNYIIISITILKQ